ncbi:uncharacterized protein LOC105279459 isoform X1 [Ooceraea biroi]|uniref:uncharacterized protein LOC105279459 isoform X1 n=1 Tax=Ooceraea biroi TaxID=2015173 RepID=UPI000F092DCD|nr:uncharacterized protein LOC105279459 isoform X1 [Ooceraea biroi]XP_026829995.1 uncharacterized protein LOC105279459 isoform X1 [Ooceraea biroi]
MTEIVQNGIIFKGKIIPVSLRCFIANIPARSFSLNHKGHMSLKPCSRCKVSGKMCERRVVFLGSNHPLRNDVEYERRIDASHHKQGAIPLSGLPMGLVSQVPFDYMHLVCLGVVKRMLRAWVDGGFEPTRLSATSLKTVSARMEIVKHYCPRDFARLPRSITDYNNFKATEFRQFLLYTGPGIMYGILNESIYLHFLILHAAIRILVSQTPSEDLLTFAEMGLQIFVEHCPSLYGSHFVSFNIHGLLHLVQDFRNFGSLDTFFAFPYENNMTAIRRMCRKPGQILQQIRNRMREGSIGKKIVYPQQASIKMFDSHKNAPITNNLLLEPEQYRK